MHVFVTFMCGEEFVPHIRNLNMPKPRGCEAIESVVSTQVLVQIVQGHETMLSDSTKEMASPHTSVEPSSTPFDDSNLRLSQLFSNVAHSLGSLFSI